MYVDPVFRHSTVFVYYRNADGELKPAGTAFLTREAIPGTEWGWFQLVTARHILEQARVHAVSEDEVYLRVNLDDKSGADFIQVGLSPWFFHPDDLPETGRDWLRRGDSLRYDVAIMMCAESIRKTVRALSISGGGIITPEVIAEEGVGPGDEVALAGLYRNHVGQRSNIPILRAGIIAAMPEEPVATALGPMEAYLVETRSLGGLSGSPVMWLSGIGRVEGDTGFMRLVNVQSLLLGFVHGHFDAPASDKVASEAWPYPERMNEGMSIVIPVAKVLETVHQEAVMAEKHKQIESIREQISNATMDTPPDSEQS